MEISLLVSAMLAAIAWLTAIVIPIRPASTRERLDVESPEPVDLSHITALIPARDEAATIGRTLDALSRQGTGLTVIVVDDQSADDTGTVVSNWPDKGRFKHLHLVEGATPPENWLGRSGRRRKGQARSIPHSSC